MWHHLDLDFVSDHSDTGRLSAYTGGPCWSVDRRTHPGCAALGTNGAETVVMKASLRWTGKPDYAHDAVIETVEAADGTG